MTPPHSACVDSMEWSGMMFERAGWSQDLADHLTVQEVVSS